MIFHRHTRFSSTACLESHHSQPVLAVFLLFASHATRLLLTGLAEIPTCAPREGNEVTSFGNHPARSGGDEDSLLSCAAVPHRRVRGDRTLSFYTLYLGVPPKCLFLPLVYLLPLSGVRHIIPLLFCETFVSASFL